MLWSHPQPNKWSVHANTPIYHKGDLFYFSGYGQGSGKLKISEDGSSASRVWTNQRFDSRMGGAVLVDGKIYGSGDRNRQWQCIDWDTGKVLYSTKDIGNGVVITAEGLLYLYSQRGELVLARPGQSSFEIISETQVSMGSGQHWAHPVIDKGRLFVRHGDTLIAYNIRR